MAITSDPTQKHAFLFTGNTGARWLADLKKVFTTLKDYYNYPAGQIYVVSGDGLLVESDFPSATRFQVTGLDGTANTDLQKVLGDFIAATDLQDHTSVYYFTGALDTSNNFILGATTLIIDPTWLGNVFNDIDHSGSFAHLIMQQGYAGGFDVAFNYITCGGRTFTAACSDVQDSDGIASGSYFTDAWTAGLQFNKNSSNKYAYELFDGTYPIIDPYPLSTDPGLLITLAQACLYAAGKLPSYGSSNTPVYMPAGAETPYLGKPELYIRDKPAWDWWESPDIWLDRRTGPPPTPPDLYDCDDLPVGWVPGATLPDPLYDYDEATWIYNNIINMRYWNIGTHPVRLVSLAVELYRTGLGYSNKQMRIEDQIPNRDTTGILLPVDRSDVDSEITAVSGLVRWNYPFFEGITHQCVQVELEQKKADLDFSWMMTSGTEKDREAQRNLDPDPACPPPPPIMEEPDSSEETPVEEIPDEPENGTEAPGTGTEQGANTFRGIKEHIYEIRNPFKKPRKFILQFPANYLNSRKYMMMEWYQITDENDRKPRPLEVVFKSNRLFIPFLIKEKTSVIILSKLRVNHKFREIGEIILPFNILVEETKPLRSGKKRRISNFKGMRSIAGFTVKTMPRALTMEGRALDEKERPIPGAKIHVETGNRRRWVNLTTDKYGAYKLANISPDIYRLWIGPQKPVSKKYVVNLTGEKYKKVDLYINKEKKSTLKK